MKKGFTLIELIVVIAIIAVLAAIIAPNAFRAIQKGQVSATVADLKAIKTAAMSYFADVGDFPIDEGSFDQDDGETGWDGPYLDPWPSKAGIGGTYTYEDDGDFDGDGSTGQTYVIIDDVSDDEWDKIDNAIDDGVADDGIVLRNSGAVAATELGFLIAGD